MEHCFKFLTFEIFPSSLFLILVSNKIIGISQGNRSSGPKVISSEVISPGTRVMSPEIHSHLARNFIGCINLKKGNILSKNRNE